MNISNKIPDWLTLPSFELARYRCQDCGEETSGENDICPSCGGELEETEGVPAFDYWGPMH